MSRTKTIHSGFKAVTHVIFDMDGLLLDTEKIYTEITQNILTPHGKIYTPDIKSQVMGLPGEQVAKIIVDLYELPFTPEEYIEKAFEQMLILMPHAELLSGVEKFVRHLHQHKIPMAVATSSSKDSYNIKTQRHEEFFSLFNHKVTGGSDSDVKKGKPSPDIFLVCASRFPDQPSPEQCLVFEDAPNGVQAAIDAGMQCIMIPDPAIVPLELQKKATLIVKSMENIQPEIFGLPPFE